MTIEPSLEVIVVAGSREFVVPVIVEIIEEGKEVSNEINIKRRWKSFCNWKRTQHWVELKNHEQKRENNFIRINLKLSSLCWNFLLFFLKANYQAEKKTTVAKKLFFSFSLFVRENKVILWRTFDKSWRYVLNFSWQRLAKQKRKRRNFLMSKSYVEKKFHFLFFFSKKVVVVFYQIFNSRGAGRDLKCCEPGALCQPWGPSGPYVFNGFLMRLLLCYRISCFHQ